MHLRSLITKFRRPFKPMDLFQFQSFVLATLREHFSAMTFSPMDDPQVIALGKVEFGLQNVYAIYARDELHLDEITGLVVDHFRNAIDTVDTATQEKTVAWDAAQPRLRPQFMPAEYTDRIPVLHIPFHKQLHIGLVLDEERRYAYVREEDAASWNRSAQELLDIAIANLAAVSKGIAVSTSQGPEQFLGVEEKDGYDAVRILLPGLRAFAADQLGEPFHAAFPNRDFLFLWSTKCSPAFHKFAAEKIEGDFVAQPYPLSSEIFQVYRDGVRHAILT